MDQLDLFFMSPVQGGRKMRCCRIMGEALIEEDIVVRQEHLFMYGHPRFVNDGDGRMDDMTDEYEILFCPFCGRRSASNFDTALNKGGKEVRK